MHFTLHRICMTFIMIQTHDHTECWLCVCMCSVYRCYRQRLNRREIPHLPEGTLRNWFTSLGSALMAGTEFVLRPLEPWRNKNKQTNTKTKMIVGPQNRCLWSVSTFQTTGILHVESIKALLENVIFSQQYLIIPVLNCYTGINVCRVGCGDSKHSWRQTQTVYTDRAKANHTRPGQRPLIMHTQRETQDLDQTPHFWVSICIVHNLKLIGPWNTECTTT